MRDVFERANQAAREAQESEIKTGGPENPYDFDCGFAWVTLDGRSSFVIWCRNEIKKLGFKYDAGNLVPLNGYRKGYWNTPEYRECEQYGFPGYPKGWQFWCPGDFNGQSVRIHLAGARAFARTLNDCGFEAHVNSRLD